MPYLRQGIRFFYTLEQKSEIVELAYSEPNNVKPVARCFNVQTKQIRAWKRQLEAEENPLPVYPAPRTAEERFAIKKVKTKFTWHKGRESFLNNDKKHFIIFTFELYRERGILVSAKLLALDLIRQYPDLHDIPARNIIHRVRLYLKADENITHRWITHMAQNVRFHEAIIADFVDYCNRQIAAGRYGADQIVNMDETNLTST
jgi:transposase-like protein